MQQSPTTMVRRRAPAILFPAGLGLMLLTFAGMALWLGIGLWEQHDWLYGSLGILLALVLCGACAAVLLWFRARRKLALGPTPWLARKDWAKGEIPAVENAPSVVGLGILGATGCLTAAFLFVSPLASGVDAPLKWIALLFGVAFGGGAAYTRAFRRKFGKSYFKMDSVPGRIGGTLGGAIVLGARCERQTAFRVRLCCLKTEPGTSDTNYAKILWQSAEVVAHAQATSSAESAVPVQFALPDNCAESDNEAVAGRVLWQLTAQADFPGLHYAANFEVPVFRRLNE